MLFILHSCTRQSNVCMRRRWRRRRWQQQQRERLRTACYTQMKALTSLSVLLSAWARSVGWSIRWFLHCASASFFYIQQKIFTHTQRERNKQAKRIEYKLIKETEAQLNSDNNNVDDDNKKEEKQTNKTHLLVYSERYINAPDSKTATLKIPNTRTHAYDRANVCSH